MKADTPLAISESKRCTVPHFAKPPLPVTALASVPGSGNTWTRHLLEQATGKSSTTL